VRKEARGIARDAARVARVSNRGESARVSVHRARYGAVPMASLVWNRPYENRAMRYRMERLGIK